MRKRVRKRLLTIRKSNWISSFDFRGWMEREQKKRTVAFNEERTVRLLFKGSIASAIYNPVCCRGWLFSRVDCFCRTSVCASSTVSTHFRVDAVFVTFWNCSYRALIDTCAACNTIVTNYVSHFVKYLVDNFCWCKNRAFFVFKKFLGRYFIKNIVFCNNGRSFSL